MPSPQREKSFVLDSDSAADDSEKPEGLSSNNHFYRTTGIGLCRSTLKKN